MLTAKIVGFERKEKSTGKRILEEPEPYPAEALEPLNEL